MSLEINKEFAVSILLHFTLWNARAPKRAYTKSTTTRLSPKGIFNGFYSPSWRCQCLLIIFLWIGAKICTTLSFFVKGNTYTPIHCAAMLENVSIMQTLLAAFPVSLLELKDARGNTPLHIAAMANQVGYYICLSTLLFLLNCLFLLCTH